MLLPAGRCGCGHLWFLNRSQFFFLKQREKLLSMVTLRTVVSNQLLVGVWLTDVIFFLFDSQWIFLNNNMLTLNSVVITFKSLDLPKPFESHSIWWHRRQLLAWWGLAGAASCHPNFLWLHEFEGSSSSHLPVCKHTFASQSRTIQKSHWFLKVVRLFLYFTCMGVWLCVCLYTLLIQCQQRTEEDVGSPRPEVAGICEPVFGCWELNVGLLKEQQVPWTPKPSIQPPVLGFESYTVVRRGYPIFRSFERHSFHSVKMMTSTCRFFPKKAQKVPWTL